MCDAELKLMRRSDSVSPTILLEQSFLLQYFGHTPLILGARSAVDA